VTLDCIAQAHVKVTGMATAGIDSDGDSAVNVLDILLYKSFVDTSCTNPPDD
jgi:hypothetical protein